jgi:hypothetical protein
LIPNFWFILLPLPPEGTVCQYLKILEVVAAAPHFVSL